MKTRVVLGVALAGVLIAAAACSESLAMAGVEDNGSEMRVGLGQVLEVELESNPTTGYSWQVVEVPECLELTEGPTFVSEADGEVVGAGGTEIMRFTTTGAGTGTLVLEYRRPWETDVAAEDVYELTVTVK